MVPVMTPMLLAVTKKKKKKKTTEHADTTGLHGHHYLPALQLLLEYLRGIKLHIEQRFSRGPVGQYWGTLEKCQLKWGVLNHKFRALMVICDHKLYNSTSTSASKILN